MQRSTSTLTVVLAALLLSGCTSPRAILATSGPTMQELIEGGGQRTRSGATGRSMVAGGLADTDREALRASIAWQAQRSVELQSYTRTAETEIAQLFPRHVNPTITIYVYPHLATVNDAPVPGYTTAIPLYPVDPYALPGEQPMPLR